MNVSFAYARPQRRRASRRGRRWQALSLVPNLAREPVAFDAPLRAAAALPRGDQRAARRRHQRPPLQEDGQDRLPGVEEAARPRARRPIRREACKAATTEIAGRVTARVVPPDLAERLRQPPASATGAPASSYSDYLRKHDPNLWRHADAVRPGHHRRRRRRASSSASPPTSRATAASPSIATTASAAPTTSQLGTTNVDYSWDLYDHFQTLRTYRETRFRIDPAGFEVATGRPRATTARRRSTCPTAGSAASCRCRPR